MDNEYNTLSSLLGGAIQAMATRPQKTSTFTNITSTSTPYALQDMIAARDSIGLSTKKLNDALKARESMGYSILNSLSGIPQQQGAGSWLTDFARAFGGSAVSPTNAAVDRAQQVYEAELKDLANRLAYDKAMGETTTQRQSQTMGYTPMEYSTAGARGKGGAGEDTFAGVPERNFRRSVGYDPVENLPDFGPVTRAAISEEQLGTMKYVPLSQSLAKGVAGKKAPALQTTWSDISDNILSGRILDFVGKAGGIRVADTPAEQEFIFGPIRNYQNMSKDQLQTGLKQARNNFVAAGLNKARKQGVEVSAEELKDWFNSAFSVPEGKQTKTMYNVQDVNSLPKSEPVANTISVGEVRNGYRFKGGDPKKKENWEKI